MLASLPIALVLGLAYFRRPRLVLLWFLCFLLLQDFAIALSGGRSTLLGGAFQALDETGLLALAVASAITARASGRLRIARWCYWALAFAAASMASVALARSGWERAAIGLLLLSKGLLFGFAVDQTRWRSEDGELWLRTLIWIAMVFALFAIPDVIAPVAFRSFIGFSPLVEYRGSLPSVVSLAGHPGGYAWLLTSALLVSMAALLTGHRGRWLLVAVVLMAGMLLSSRRKPFIGIVAALLFALPLRSGRLRRKQALVAVLVLFAIVLPTGLVLWPVLREGFQGYFGESAVTVQARTALYAGSLLLSRQYFPFGVGLGKYGSYGSIVDYSDVYYRFGFDAIYGMSPAYPNFIQDTFWPQVLGETGLLGLVCFAGILASILWACGSRVRHSKGHASWLPLAAYLILIETMFESFAAPSFTTASQACLSVGLARLAVAGHATSTSEEA